MARRPEPAWKTALAGPLSEARRVVVLGVGNPGGGDDAAGVLVASALSRPRPKPPVYPAAVRPEAKIIIGGVVPESTTGDVRAFAPDLVVLVDAVAAGDPPGTIRVLRVEDLAEEELTTHRLPLSLLVRYLEASLGCRTVIVGLASAETGPGRPVSGPVRKAVSELVRFLAGRLFG